MKKQLIKAGNAQFGINRLTKRQQAAQEMWHKEQKEFVNEFKAFNELPEDAKCVINPSMGTDALFTARAISFASAFVSLALASVGFAGALVTSGFGGCVSNGCPSIHTCRTFASASK